MNYCILSTYATKEICDAVDLAQKTLQDFGHRIVVSPRQADVIIIDDSLKQKIKIIRNETPSKDGISKYTDWQNFFKLEFI